jgi:outer membrane receptor for ferrienterochelin and colicins
MNANIVGEDNKSGMSVYGFHRERNPFDANSDSFSELSKINNLTAGARFFYKTGSRGKLSIDYFMINETRRGGNKFEMPLHETDIAEALTHNISSAACTYEQFYRKHDKLSLYISGQRVKRDSYYGALQSLKDYGNTSDFTYALGAQYVANFNLTNITIGFENTAGWLLDKKLGYPVFENNISNITFHEGNTLIAHQMSITSGIYFQYNLHLEKLNVSAGGRLDNYSIRDFVNESDQTKSGYVLSPRLSVMYDINKYIQARINYSQGYRAPQIFDEDLHIETSGSRKVVHQNHPDLIQETSHSISTSIDYNYAYGNSAISFLTEGFYTILKNPFANSYGLPDTLGAVIYTRINSDGTAFVAGVNIEIKIIPNKKWLISSGYTYQHSAYSTPQEFNETQFLRTPNTYGFLTVDYKAFKHFGVSINGTNTGKMLVPYFGIQQENPNLGELRVTKAFYDIGLKLRYTIKLNSMCIQIFSGIKNILNSYQNDFDSGILRDPGYIYGPTQPRTIYLGFKLGNGKINI